MSFRWIKKEDSAKVIQIISIIVSLFLGVALLFVTCKFSSTANLISKESNRISLEMRKAQIRPKLEVMPLVMSTHGQNHLIIRIKNIGLGSANNPVILIEKDDEFKSLQYISEFYPNGTFPLIWPAVDHEMFGGFGPRETTPRQNYLLPGDELEFQCGQSPGFFKGLFTFYISYFDIDGNEYLTIQKKYSYGMQGMMYGTSKKNLIIDSLKVLAGHIKRNESITFEDIDLRKSVGSIPFKYLERKMADSINDSL